MNDLWITEFHKTFPYADSFDDQLLYPLRYFYTFYTDSATLDSAWSYLDTVTSVKLAFFRKAEVPQYESLCIYSGDTNLPDDFATPALVQTFNPHKALDRVNAAAAWQITEGCEDIGIAILDGGQYLLSHPELSGGKVIYVGDKVDTDSIDATLSPHHVAVAVLAAGNTNNGEGLASVGNKSSLLLLNQSSFLEGYANGGRVFNCSYIYTQTKKNWLELASDPKNIASQHYAQIRFLYKKGCVLVGGAGNGLQGAYRPHNTNSDDCPGTFSLDFGNGVVVPHNKMGLAVPASLDEFISVSSINSDLDSNGQVTYFSGNNLIHTLNCAVDILAPGFKVPTTQLKDTDGDGYYHEYEYNDTYGYGTSFASPIVAGAAALILSVNPCLTPENVRQIIMQSADTTIHQLYPLIKPYSGAGVLNVGAAVALAQNFTVNYSAINGPVATDTTINTNLFVAGDIVIEPGATLTIENCTINFEAWSKIVVKAGAKLKLNNAVLTSGICQRWEGIQVWGNRTQPASPLGQHQGLVEITNSTVENAMIGVRLGRPLHPAQYGGTVIATNATFRNNAYSVYFHPYPTANASRFMNCLFEEIGAPFSPNLGWGSQQASMPSGSVPADLPAAVFIGEPTMVYLNLVTGINFFNCRFINSDAKAIQKHTKPSFGVDFFRGVGIHAYNSYFGVYGSVSGAAGSSFEYLREGIRAEYFMATKSFVVKNTHFHDNLTGIRSVGSTNMIVSSCTFDWFHNLSNSTGIILDGSTMFKVNNNTFELPFKKGNSIYGIYVYNSGFESPDLMNNSFKRILAGLFFKGLNYDKSAIAGSSLYYAGLKPVCNQFDLTGVAVFADDDGEGVHAAIGKYLTGKYAVEAGNTFNADSIPPYFNDLRLEMYSFDLYYNHHLDSIYIPLKNYSFGSSQIVLVPGGSFQPSDCRQILPFDSVKERFSESYQGYIGLKMAYENLIDGGSTPATLFQIQTTTSQDAWQLRTDLLAESPYLSEEVLHETVDAGVLPNALLFEVLMANPHASRDESLMNKLSAKPDPMPAYMIQALQGNEEVFSNKDSIDLELARLQTLNYSSSREVVRTYLTDTTLANSDSVRIWLSRGIGPAIAFEQAYYLQSKGRAASSDSVINFINANYDLSETLSQYLTDYMSYSQVYRTYHDSIGLGKTVTSSDSTVLRTLVDQPGITGANARVLLRLTGDTLPDIFPPRPVPGGGVSNKRQQDNTVAKAATEVSEVVVAPNPADEYLIVSLLMEKLPEQVDVKIIDTRGAVVYHRAFRDKRVFSIVLSSLNSGTYVIKLSGGRDFELTKKFVISH